MSLCAAETQDSSETNKQFLEGLGEAEAGSLKRAQQQSRATASGTRGRQGWMLFWPLMGAADEIPRGRVPILPAHRQSPAHNPHWATLYPCPGAAPDPSVVAQVRSRATLVESHSPETSRKPSSDAARLQDGPGTKRNCTLIRRRLSQPWHLPCRTRYPRGQRTRTPAYLSQARPGVSREKAAQTCRGW